jgi:O-antigen/teichoic acid export membrane protein
MSILRRFINLFFSNQSRKQTIIKNISWLAFSEVIVSIIKMVFLGYLARELGAELVGQFFYMIAILNILFIPSDMGLGTLIIRDYYSQPQLVPKLLACRVVLLIGVLILPVGYMIGFLEPVLSIPFIILTVKLMSDQLSKLLQSRCQAMNKMEWVTSAQLMDGLLTVVIAIGLLQIGNPLVSPLVLLCLGYLAGSMCALMLLILLSKPRFQFSGIRELGGYFKHNALPLKLTGIIQSVIANMDELFIKIFLGLSAVGHYGLLKRIIYYAVLPPRVVSQSVYPILSRDWHANNSVHMVKKTLFLLSASAVSVFMIMSTQADHIIESILGSSLILLTPILQGYLIVTAIAYPTIFIQNIMVIKDQLKEIAIVTVIMLGINFVGNWVFIVRFGMSGVIMSTIVAQIFYLVVTMAIIHYRLKLKILNRTFLQIPVASLVFLVSFYNAGIISVSLQCVAYIGVFILFKNEDVISLFTMVKKRGRLLKHDY